MGKSLIDIRYYASEEPNVFGKSLPSSCSRFFDFPKSFHYWGARIAQRVGSEGLSLGNFDHLYINFTEALPEGDLQLSNRTPEKWLRYIDVGVIFNELSQLSEEQLEQFVINKTMESLFFLSDGDKEKHDIIEAAAKDVEEFGTEIELPVKVKETKSYSVIITYKLRPKQLKSYGIAKYTNHKTREHFITNFIELNSPSDIFQLVGSITVKAGKILIKPRSSFRAGLYTKCYKVPIELDIKEHINA